MTDMEALTLVLELAIQSALGPSKCDPDLLQEAYRQQEAIDLVRREFMGAL